jgi:hypothetical protein
MATFAACAKQPPRALGQQQPADQWIKEGKQAAAMTWLSCHSFRANEVRRG